ncbi:MAG: MBL fold metallo-hydrolase [Emcibacter sp.]|nr:MBL fold metallo-hydrolase [Emcibacter sp.]
MTRFISLSIIFYITFIGIVTAQNNYDDVEIKSIKVEDGIYMLMGAGGNIGLSSGEDGVFMIDDQYSPLTLKIVAAIKKISDNPIKFVLNTHWHWDHTGGNENLGKTNVVIVAHDNVYERLTHEQFIKIFNRKTTPSPKKALPVISFNDQVTFHLNGLHIQAHHINNAHTDGDSIIIFKDKNVIHTGDIFFNGMYPFIDTGAGGSIYGMIAGANTILALADDKTKIIPGHGPLANKKDLENFRDMLIHVVDNVTPLVKKGLSLEEAVKQDPLKDLNEKWAVGFLKPDVFLATVYQTIQDHQK